jgi:signal transduction histidine kinase/integral membrane sensor domain MASE1
VATLAAAAYAAGILIGLVLRLPPSTPSVLWPPNATLTAFFLLLPLRRWPAVLLGAAIAHLALELAVFPWPLVVALFLTNSGEALIAALFVRRFSDRPDRFDTLKRTALFLLGGGVLAPFLSSFADAGVVHLVNGEDYWDVWKARFLANVLSEIAIVPPIVYAVTTGAASVRTWLRRDWTQAALIAAGFAGLAIVIPSETAREAVGPWPLPLFLPLMLWAAVRFGPMGAGLSIVTTVLALVGSAVYGYEMLGGIPADDRVRLLQVFLIVVSIPLMCVAALVEERRHAEETALANDTLKSAILASLASLVVVLDRDGRIITANDSWLKFARRNRLPTDGSAPGTSYLDVWKAPVAAGAANARAVVDGVRSVLAGTATGYSGECRLELGEAARWLAVTVVPLQHERGGAVVTHSDATLRRNAELDAQRSREQIARITRTLAMGELTSSLWHRLSQPLTGIMGNAQAGRRFLDTSPPNLVEIRHIFADIVADTVRAAGIIDSLRDSLRKAPSDHQLLDMNEVVRDTTALVTDEALTRNVQLQMALAPKLMLVRGERLLVQQVVLNLIMNGLEALSNDRLEKRVVIVTTAAHADQGVLVSVSDSGNGVPPGAEDDIFEPFYSTKPAGSGGGLGLSISRAIVEAHGGRIWLDSTADAGTTVNLTLPAAEEGAVV